MTAILPSSFLDAALIYASSRDADCSPGFDNTAFSRSSDIESFTSAAHSGGGSTPSMSAAIRRYACISGTSESGSFSISASILF